MHYPLARVIETPKRGHVSQRAARSNEKRTDDDKQ